MSNKIKVIVRVRPLVPSEIEYGAEKVVHTERDRRVRVSVPAKNNTFEFDGAYGQNISQESLYHETCRPLIDSFFTGYNATVFAYGTGSFYFLSSFSLHLSSSQVKLDQVKHLRWETMAVTENLMKELFHLLFKISFKDANC
jgi:hypothetical protein